MKHTVKAKTIKIETPSEGFNLRNAIFSLIVSGVLVAPLLYLDHRKDRDQFVTVSWLPGSLAIDAAILAILALALAALLYLFIQRMPSFLRRNADRNPLPRLRLEFDRRSILCATAIIFVLWIPCMLLFYPCASNHDFINQVYQYQATGPTFYTTLGTVIDAEFIDHHPIFDTLVYGWFFTLGDAMGSQNAGMFLFSITQNLLIATTLALSVCYLDRLEIPKCLRIAALVFAIFFPYYPTFASVAMKDTLFVVGFTPFCLCYIEAIRSKGRAFAKPSFIVGFIVATGLCILTKKLGIYICAASLLVMIIFLKGARLKSAGVLVASVLAFSLAFPAVVYPAIGGVAPGGRQESLCFALQQTTYLLINHPEAVSSEDLAVIEKVLDTEAAKESFRPALADGAKNRWRQEATSADTLNYIKVWAKEGLHNPKSYLLATAQCCGQMLIPSKQLSYQVNISDKKHLENWGANFSKVSEGYNMELERPESLVKACTAMRSFLLKGIGKVPVLNLITTIALYGAWIPFLCVAITFLRRKGAILALAPIMWSVCTLLISPGSLGRYVISLLFMIIPMVGWMVHSFQDESDEDPLLTGKHAPKA